MDDIKNIAMDINELSEHLRGIDIPDCKKYKELLESNDKEVIRLAIELLTIDRIENVRLIDAKKNFYTNIVEIKSDLKT